MKEARAFDALYGAVVPLYMTIDYVREFQIDDNIKMVSILLCKNRQCVACVIVL
jgi:hypothetical protein